MKERLRLVQIFKISIVVFIISAIPLAIDAKVHWITIVALYYALLVMAAVAGISTAFLSVMYVVLGWKFVSMLNKANCLTEDKDIKFAISAYGDLIEIAEEDWLMPNRVYGNLGLIYRRAKKREKALAMLEKQDACVEEEYSLVMINIYLETNQWQKAEAFYLEHIEKGDSLSHSYYGLARVEAYARKKDEALKNLELAVENGFADAGLLEDKKFDCVRDDERFKKIIENI